MGKSVWEAQKQKFDAWPVRCSNTHAGSFLLQHFRLAKVCKCYENQNKIGKLVASNGGEKRYFFSWWNFVLAKSRKSSKNFQSTSSSLKGWNEHFWLFRPLFCNTLMSLCTSKCKWRFLMALHFWRYFVFKNKMNYSLLFTFRNTVDSVSGFLLGDELNLYLKNYSHL